MARIAIIGTGYVGLTTGVCLASLGHHVSCLDKDPTKIDKLSRGESPIFEEGLQELLAKAISEESISFTTDLLTAVSDAEFIFVCLPTPDRLDGSVDLSHLVEFCTLARDSFASGSCLIIKSTVQVGTAHEVASMLERPDIEVVSNPEFLREGTAITDFMQPERVVVGSFSERAAIRVATLYEQVAQNVIITSPTSAELIKYASNAFLATKIAFANSIAAICDEVGADVRQVTKGMGLDKRIGSEFLRPGPGFGGSCFPKDTLGLLHLSRQSGFNFSLLQGVVDANRHQMERIANRTVDLALSAPIDGHVAVLGLTFKAGTDDRRHSPAVEVSRKVCARGLRILAFDPTVYGHVLPEVSDIEITESLEDCVRGAVLVVVLTEWREFIDLDPNQLIDEVAHPIVFDTRNILDQQRWESSGFRYIGNGLGLSP